MAIEIVELPVLYVSLPKGKSSKNIKYLLEIPFNFHFPMVFLWFWEFSMFEYQKTSKNVTWLQRPRLEASSLGVGSAPAMAQLRPEGSNMTRRPRHTAMPVACVDRVFWWMLMVDDGEECWMMFRVSIYTHTHIYIYIYIIIYIYTHIYIYVYTYNIPYSQTRPGVSPARAI